MRHIEVFVLESGVPRRARTPTPLRPGQHLVRKDEVVRVDWPGQSDAVRVGLGRSFTVTWSSGRVTHGSATSSSPAPEVGKVEWVPADQSLVTGEGTPRYEED